MLSRLDDRLRLNREKIKDEEELIKVSLREAFWDVENEFLETARKGYQLGCTLLI